MSKPTRPIALTIAGSDSGGGAGIQADLKTFHAFKVFGTSAVTAVTAQNTLGVSAIHAVPISVVQAQIRAVAVDLPPAAVKSGMLATAELVTTVAEEIRAHELPNYVLDPVMVATSGDRLLDEEAEEAVARELVPLATLVTPNLHEAGILTGTTVETLDQMKEAARALVEMGAGAALVKGGHLPGGQAADVLWTGSGERVWQRKHLDTVHTHGTGCTLSAAVAAALADGLAMQAAVHRAVTYVAKAILTAPQLGSGNGPVNHFARIGA